MNWLISLADEVYGMCSRARAGQEIPVNETMRLELEASVTNAENGQLVRASASTIIHKRNLRMGFSLPSPAVSHPDMPFMAWVRNYQLSCIIWLYNIPHCLSRFLDGKKTSRF